LLRLLVLNAQATATASSLRGTAADVATAVQAQTGIDIDRRKLHFDPIKTVGQHSVTVRLHSDVEFPVTVDVAG
jgi:large subunit ribosomal protein L9